MGSLADHRSPLTRIRNPEMLRLPSTSAPPSDVLRFYLRPQDLLEAFHRFGKLECGDFDLDDLGG